MSGSASVQVRRAQSPVQVEARRRAPQPAQREVEATRPQGKLGFVLFLLVNAVLFIRPAEVLPSLAALPIYEVLILCCLIASAKDILPQLGLNRMLARPVTLCVIGMFVAIVLSHASHFNLYMAREAGLAFLKVVLYYLMLVAVVSTPQRFRVFLQVIAVYILIIAGLALLNHYGFIHLEALDAMAMAEGYDEEMSERVVTVRLQASGIFNDPNDFSLILNVGILLSTHLVLREKRVVHRAALVGVLGVLMFALAMTRSRGGFLAMIVGMGVLFVSRFGWKRAMMIGALGLPLVVVAFGGRQTNINMDGDDTGHARVAVWRDAIAMFRAAPLFGAGYGMMSEELRIVAHNSFVHSFAELGFFGGAVFLAAFYLPVSFLRENGRPHAQRGWSNTAVAQDLRDWRACVLAVIVSFGIGLCSLSRAYTVTTYIILGIAAAYTHLCIVHGAYPAPLPVGVMLRRVAGMSVVFLVAVWLFVKVVL